MAKIGTAHVEIKPVISDEVLEVITSRIADAVAEGVKRGMQAAAPRPIYGDIHVAAPGVSFTTYKNTSASNCDCTWCSRGLDHPEPTP